jgi:caa(3)-type oxidase subunit IV
MSERLLTPLTYILVCVALVLLTILTVGLSFVEAPNIVHIVMGLAIGVVKAALVVLFFMEIIQSPRITWMVLGVTVFWLVAVLIILMFSDYITRGILPYAPGH